ncbi:MAG: FAD-binding protein, partial [Chloroflexi bacterium]|nr:FAD-binding protein [Chloroflexota bacterium]
MKLQASQTIKTDVLVIGGGGAGLRAAIEAKRHGCNVLLVSESPVGFRNNTALSKATFIAGIKKPGDSPELYIEDTLAGGRFLNDLKMVKIAIREAEQQVSDLIKFGVNFKKKDGELLIGQETGHRYPRLVFGGSRRGIDLTMPLKDYAAKTGVKFTEGVLVSKLLQSEGALVGALAVNDKGQVFVFNAKSTILATGGLGELFQRHDNALGLTGDGYALAYELGITLRDMEFVQFYPTTWGNHGSKICPFEMYILEGATMWNSLGEDILKRHGIDNPVSVTRYRLMRIIMEEVAEGRGVEGGVTFDFTTILEKRKQELYRDGLLRKGEYPDKFQVAPAVHYFLGGVKINEKAETGINGLYAAGEVCGGMNGANRIGGNALVEMFVFGTIAGESAAVRASNVKLIPFSQREVKTEVERLTKFTSDNSRGDIEELRQSLKR